MKGIKQSFAVLLTVCLFGGLSYTSLAENGALAQGKALAVQNARLAADLTLVKTGQTKLFTGLIHEVRFLVTDPAGAPVSNIQIKNAATGGHALEQMPLFDDLLMDASTNYRGQTIHRLSEGSYTATLTGYAGDRSYLQTHSFSVGPEARTQNVSFVWQHQAPARYYSALSNRLEITVTDKSGKPLTQIVGKLYLPKAGSFGADAQVTELPLLHTDKQGKIILPLPSQQTARLLLFSDNNYNFPRGEAYAQTTDVTINKQKGVLSTRVVFSPQAAPIIKPRERFSQKALPNLDKLSPAQLTKKIEELKAENAEIRAQIDTIG